METIIELYHGSKVIVEKPKFGFGKPFNDYGRGFYCTESIELAREWACPSADDGICNKFILDTEGLNVIHLTRGRYNILSWMAVLLTNRQFEVKGALGYAAKEHIIKHFRPDTSTADVMIGYRADDSYFTFAQDFLNGMTSVRDLEWAMRLGNLGEQVVLISEKAYSQIQFIGSEVVDHEVYYPRRVQRDAEARQAYREYKKNLEQFQNDVYVLDIIRENMGADDERLQSVIS